MAQAIVLLSYDIVKFLCRCLETLYVLNSTVERVAIFFLKIKPKPMYCHFIIFTGHITCYYILNQTF